MRLYNIVNNIFIECLILNLKLVEIYWNIDIVKKIFYDLIWLENK